MAKRKEETKPMFPLKHEFYASLDHFMHQAGMLRDAVRQAVQLGAIKEGPLKDLLTERLAEFDKARMGESED